MLGSVTLVAIFFCRLFFVKNNVGVKMKDNFFWKKQLACLPFPKESDRL
jgi:hypothetical protein